MTSELAAPAAVAAALMPPPFAWTEGPVVGRGAFGVVRLGVVTSAAGDGAPPPGTAIAVKEIPLAGAGSWAAVCREAAAMAVLRGAPHVVQLLGVARRPPDASSPLDRAVLLLQLAHHGSAAQAAAAWFNGAGAPPPPFGDDDGAPLLTAGSVPFVAASGDAGESGASLGLPAHAVRRCLRQLLEALCAVHAAGLAHRDVKGSNVLLVAGVGGHSSTPPEACLADFGSALLSPAARALAAALDGRATAMGPHPWTAAGSSWEGDATPAPGGTLAWSAPEAIAGPLTGDGAPAAAWQAADVWSVGCTALELLTGRPPWDGVASCSAEVHLHLGASSDLRAHLPRWLGGAARSFVAACLHPSPACRPSAAALLGHPFLEPGAAAEARSVPAALPHVATAGGDDGVAALDRLLSAARACTRAAPLCRLARRMAARGGMPTVGASTACDATLRLRAVAAVHTLEGGACTDGEGGEDRSSWLLRWLLLSGDAPAAPSLPPPSALAASTSVAADPCGAGAALADGVARAASQLDGPIAAHFASITARALRRILAAPNGLEAVEPDELIAPSAAAMLRQWRASASPWLQALPTRADTAFAALEAAAAVSAAACALAAAGHNGALASSGLLAAGAEFAIAARAAADRLCGAHGLATAAAAPCGEAGGGSPPFEAAAGEPEDEWGVAEQHGSYGARDAVLGAGGRRPSAEPPPLLVGREGASSLLHGVMQLWLPVGGDPPAAGGGRRGLLRADAGAVVALLQHGACSDEGWARVRLLRRDDHLSDVAAGASGGTCGWVPAGALAPLR